MTDGCATRTGLPGGQVTAIYSGSAGVETELVQIPRHLVGTGKRTSQTPAEAESASDGYNEPARPMPMSSSLGRGPAGQSTQQVSRADSQPSPLLTAHRLSA